MSTPGPHNVVIIAQNSNPSIFTQLWLCENGIFSRAEVESNFVFTPMAVSLTTQDISFLSLPDRIQLGFMRPPAAYQELINRTMVRIVTLLPHIPFKAIGFNLLWNVVPRNQEKYAGILRRLFLSPDNPLGRYFREEDCRFGSYLSKNYEYGRLRIEVKPVFLPNAEGRSIEGLQLIFNFNRDLQEVDRPRQMLDFLASWDTSHSMALDMVNSIGSGWSE